MTNQDLIARAASVVRGYRNGDHMVGDVGCALETASGAVHTGVCIDAPSGMGFCAEHSAIAAMITAGETRIARIVAVWKKDEDIYVLSPCGRCRQFIYQTDKANLATQVLLSAAKVLPLSDLLPYHDWFEKLG